MVDYTGQEKDRQRRELLCKRNAQQQSRQQIHSQIICDRIESLLPCGLKTLFLYAAVRSEVLTYPLIEKMWKRNIRVALPKTEGKNLRFYIVRDYSELEETAKLKIPEPKPQICPEATTEASVLVVPVVGFDESCNRMGYGGGFYDRYLAFHKTEHDLVVGVAFELQLQKNLICERTDQRPDMIITENRMIKSEGLRILG